MKVKVNFLTAMEVEPVKTNLQAYGHGHGHSGGGGGGGGGSLSYLYH